MQCSHDYILSTIWCLGLFVSPELLNYHMGNYSSRYSRSTGILERLVSEPRVLYVYVFPTPTYEISLTKYPVVTFLLFPIGSPSDHTTRIGMSLHLNSLDKH